MIFFQFFNYYYAQYKLFHKQQIRSIAILAMTQKINANFSIDGQVQYGPMQQSAAQIKLYRWTYQQKQQLQKLYTIYGNDWTEISHHLNGRTPDACLSMVYSLKQQQKTNFKKRRCYSQEQDNLILELYKIYPEDWNKIAKKLENRTENSIYLRYRKLKNITLFGTRNWTIQEDNLLLQLVKILSFQWNLIAKIFVNCTHNDCYSRFRQIFQNQIKIWQFSQDNKLLELYEIYGNNWKQISKSLGNKKNKTNCYKRFNELRILNLKNRWSQEQLNHLFTEYERCKGDWKSIHKKLERFTLRECYFNYHHYKNQVKRKNKHIMDQIGNNNKLKNNKNIKQEALKIYDPSKTIEYLSQKILEQLGIMIKLAEINS